MPALSVSVTDFDPTCSYPDVELVIDAALDGGGVGEIAAGIPSDLAASALCVRQ